MRAPRCRLVAMGQWRYVACSILLLCPLALSRLDEDFAFDNNEEFQVDLTANHSEIAKNGLRRLWGVPDTSAYVGHLFRMEIPKEAFSGEVLAYKVRSQDGHRLPSWLAVDTKHGLVTGVPQKQDVGAHAFTVIAHGRTHGLTATDSFTVEVKRADEKTQSKYGTCFRNENRLQLVILIDGAFHRISHRQRIRALMELASFMALDGDEFWIEPYKSESAQSQVVLMSGVGSTKRRRSEATTAIYLNVGCGEKLWSRHKVLVAGLREQSRDGTLQQLLNLPVLGWRLIGVKPLPRFKRQSPLDEGSGAYDNYDGDYDADYSGDDEDDVDDEYNTQFDNGPVPVNVEEPPNLPHPHRHHHGQPDFAPHTTTDTFQTEPTDPPTTTPDTPPSESPTSLDPPSSNPPNSNPPRSPAPAPAPTSAATLSTEDPRADSTLETTNTYTTEEHKVKITPYSETASEASNVDIQKERVADSRRLDEHSPIIIVPEETTTSEPEPHTIIIKESNELPTSSESPTSPAPTEETVTVPMSTSTSTTTTSAPTTETSSTTTTTTTTTTPAPTTTTETSTTSTTTSAPTTIPSTTPTPEVTTQKYTVYVPPTEPYLSTIFGRTTETVPFTLPANQPPTLKHHMKKLGITAGNAFRYIIPADLFTDPEDGSNLTFTMYEAENVPLSKNSWIQFIPSEREVYGLPLEAHVSRWNFIVEAQDSEGLYARGPLDITVQQHKSGRTINHQFIMQFRLLKQYDNTVDWQIRALEGIVNLFRDTDMDHLIVLNATQNGDMCEFVWTNDTLPKDSACPIDDINRLMKIMESETERGSPSAGLARAMSPELKVSEVRWRGTGRCAGEPVAATSTPDTYPPVTRNQVDHITATVGHLLVYKVPEDTFFDPEDGGTRNLQLSLRFSDRSEIPAHNWLQFDARNQEFYGVPSPSDQGSVEYQLIAEDSSKKSAYDSLIVEVAKAPTIRPTIEFQMTMDPSPNVVYSASNRRKVVEKLAELFGQEETDNIRLESISDNPTTIIWYNTSLPMDRCPKREIEELRRMIIVDERGASGGNLRDHVDQVFDKDLKVMSIRLIPLGLCAEQHTKTPKAPPPPGPNLQNKATNASPEYSDYLVTFVIPAIVIVCMIVIAGIIACVLYRRRRTGKMSVGDEEERQAFRSKGIPVIFQDELEERADAEPADKSPVIMKEEKPPLLPPAPEYRQGDDAPYRPPPPFAASRTPPRPKATPTYRKPPPYVPP